jgi:hypothetical protein
MAKVVNSRGVSNDIYTQVEPLLSVEKLKETYLFGSLHFPDYKGDDLSDEAIQTFINNAISLLEHDLDIAIQPRRKVEFKDYYLNDYTDWGFMSLNNTPVIELESLRIVYLKQDDLANPGEEKFETVMEIPKSWIRLDPDAGMIRMLPNNKFPGRLAVGSTGAFYPELFNRHANVPHLWEVTYTHGFKAGCVPSLVNAAIGLLASIFVMNILGDLIIGAGISGTSLTLDGLSQSIQTTASAENHGFSAKVKDYARQLYGDRTIGSTGIIEALRRYYKGQQMSII